MKSLRIKTTILLTNVLNYYFPFLGAFIMLRSSDGVLKNSKYIIVLRSLMLYRCSLQGMIPVAGNSFTLPFSKFILVFVSGMSPSNTAIYLKAVRLTAKVNWKSSKNNYL